jgi:vibriolysin
MTHGVVQYTANLAYTGESGGLNEAYADIFGAMVERYVDGNVTSADTWTIGEDAYTPKTAGDALRYMSNPAKDKVSLDYYTTNAGTYDVHYSSGIANLAFYLLSEGGSHPTRGGAAMVGIGADKAAAIWYRALAYYLTSASTFTDARNATLQAATDLYGSGSAEYTAVGTSWNMVGL